MDKINHPIKLNEVSENVANLHKALKALGYYPDASDQLESKAGKSTLQQVRTLQKKLQIPFVETLLLNAPTAEAINRELEERRLLAAEHSFSVTGKTLTHTGETVPGQKLYAFDVDLRGAAVYRTVQTLDELKKNGGFQFLDKMNSDRKGAYKFTFSYPQYKTAERKYADAIVFALEDNENKGEIIGRSRLVKSTDYSDCGEVRNLDVIIERETGDKTEYELLMGQLNPFLKESKVKLVDLAASPDQITFTAQELDWEPGRIQTAAQAESIRGDGIDNLGKKLSHQLFYGIGRQDISLTWPSLFRKKNARLKAALEKSIEAKIIAPFKPKEIDLFLAKVREIASKKTLHHKHPDLEITMDNMLSCALPETAQREAFMDSLGNFDNFDNSDNSDGGYETFWEEHLPQHPVFKKNPQLIDGVLFTNRLTLLSGGHHPLVEELQVNRQLTSTRQLLELSTGDWNQVLEKTGVPEHVQGKDDNEKRNIYAQHMQNILHAAFPTQKVALMIEKEEFSIGDANVAKGINTFLAANDDFDITRSRVFDFEDQVKTASRGHFEEVKTQLLTLQRLFQVSPTPRVMAKLSESGLNSAHAIASIPQKSFIQTYEKAFGGAQYAYAVHQRASFINTRTELIALAMHEMSHSVKPGHTMSMTAFAEAMNVLEQKVPNYSNLFGSPDICECRHCRSVYSPAAYFVDLLRFLWRCEKNKDNIPQSPLDMLIKRRPDLPHLPLTCENTHTLIPYIDLVNEIMEYYTAYEKLDKDAAFDTGDATAAELRANPQNVNTEAYRKLSEAVYPFTLPYHQPLDMIRTYCGHLNTSRFEIMDTMRTDFSPAASRALEAEVFFLSPNEYTVITRETFDDTADTTSIHTYFGYDNENEDNLLEMAEVPEFLKRSGIAYTDLVELVKTRFINPRQADLDYLEDLFADSGMDAPTIYHKLEQIRSGQLIPLNDPPILEALGKKNITPQEFIQWVQDRFDGFNSVITLYQENSLCQLDTTFLRTLEKVYNDDGTDDPGIHEETWSRVHRFIRLWRKLGWSIHELDLVLYALGEEDITPQTIRKLGFIVTLNKQLKRPLDQLAVLWGDIDHYGKKSLYKKLFLNKSVQRIDDEFQANQWGNYLDHIPPESPPLLIDHVPAILAAFRMTALDLDTVAHSAVIVDNGTERHIDLEKDILDFANLSTIYRYKVLAKALKYRIPDLCLLIKLFDAQPFSHWDIQQEKYLDISPAHTLEFCKLAADVKKSGFKPHVLQYIFTGSVPPGSTLALDPVNVYRAAKSIRTAFAVIESDHPGTPPQPLTPEMLAEKLLLTFQPKVVEQFIGIIKNSAQFTTITDKNLTIDIPGDLTEKYTYIKGTGRLSCECVMTGGEKNTLETLAGASPDFTGAVGRLYQMPEDFIMTHFYHIFAGVDEDVLKKKLLNRPVQDPETTQEPEPTLEDKLVFVYKHLIPVLKKTLRENAVVQHIAALTGLEEAQTAVLLEKNLAQLTGDFSQAGYSAAYFNDTTFSSPPVLERIDPAIDFAWGLDAPDTLISADQFGVRWEALIAPPSRDHYTLVVDVARADDSFDLYIDDQLKLQKPPGHGQLSWEVVEPLDSSQIARFRLDYIHITGEASIRLSWKTPTRALEVIPSASAFPAALIDGFTAEARIYHRAAKFISQFRLNELELEHFSRFSADFANIDFKDLTPRHWIRIRDYVNLRDVLPQARATLVDVFALANKTTEPPPTLSQLRDLLHKATAWDTDALAYIIDTHFSLSPDDFKNETALTNIYNVMRLISKTGTSPLILVELAQPGNDFKELNDTAQQLKHTVKAKYEESDWLQLAGELSDNIRENQKQALIQYLLVRPELRAWGVYDADSLFEYFLIDVQMDACMDTSRIVQANSAIQLFVTRCLLNLESKIISGFEIGVSPDAIAAARWEWMKNYRVWEANRKVFLYPENWLEPEWRDDRSPFFKELESELVQNDITSRSVENAFRNYLSKLDKVANLDVCGMYYDEDTEDIHVFARTRNIPYTFFYRTLDKYWKWSAWEKVELDIRGVDDGENSGVHLIPIVWKKRLFLFWPEFMEKQDEAIGINDQTISVLAGQTAGSLKSRLYWEIRLAWSEYVDNKWTTKQLTNEYIEVRNPLYGHVKDYTFHAFIDPENQELAIWLSDGYDKPIWHCFRLSDIRARVEIDNSTNYLGTYNNDLLAGGGTYYTLKGPSFAEKMKISNEAYVSNFMKHLKTCQINYSKPQLRLNDTVYLDSTSGHYLLDSPQQTGIRFIPDYPFFYNDMYRTYFVRPVNIPVWEQIIHSIKFEPVFPQIVEYNFMGNNTLSLQNGPANVPAYGSMNTMSSKSSNFQIIESKKYGDSFAGMLKTPGTNSSPSPIDKKLEFHTFYHPFPGAFTGHLNQFGIPGLMAGDTTTPPGDCTCPLCQLTTPGKGASDNGDAFNTIYNPNWAHVYPSHSDLNNEDNETLRDRTFYKETVCFDVYGAYSIYNWELFFHAPLYIATRLSKNGKFAEAMKWFHYIFDPTTDEMPLPGQDETARYWKVLPFKTKPKETLQDFFMGLQPSSNPSKENHEIGEWRDKPFRPHLVARNRPLAYMKHVVVKYVENLVAWGDSLFRRDTMESINEATQLYVTANHILGPRPLFVPKRGKIKAQTYATLEPALDDFSNAQVQLENMFPYSSEIPVSGSGYSGGLLGIGQALYFCIPNNEKLLEHWDTVEDRLFKIRHCMNIEGVERSLALFEPPIDPAMLIKATAQGLSLSDILSDLGSPPPIYRFTYLIRAAAEFCGEVKSLGSALLSALEKKDGEELGRKRAAHETAMLGLMTSIKERQVLEAKANREGLTKSRETAKFRLEHYTALLGNDSVTVPAEPQLSTTLTADGPLPGDTIIPTVETDVDESLVDSDESGVKLIPREKEELDQSEIASDFQDAANVVETIGSALYFIPEMTVASEPLGVGVVVTSGGQSIGASSSAAAKALNALSTMNQYDAQRAGKFAGFIRREQDWTFQANMAIKEIIQLDKQITAADIRVQSAEKELNNHLQQIKNAEDIELFLRDKFTNTELYQWMQEQLYAVFKESYNMAYNMAKKAEKAYCFELGNPTASFIQYGYWDNSYKGLMSGEKLFLAIKQLEKSYIEENKRELELTKHVSVAMLNPLALHELKETGKCFVNIPEELFDLDFPGHYFRRIKSVSLSIPCIAGPYTTINCSLRLLKNTIRINTSSNAEDLYEHNNEEGVWTDDTRFRSSNIPVKSIAACTGQNDAGMFEFNFRDERYLPFEGAGAISEWKIELTADKDLRQFDYSTITDVILHMKYTAREDAGLFKQKAVNYIKRFLTNEAELETQPLMRMFSLKHDFPTEWHTFLHPEPADGDQILSITPGKDRFPFFAQHRGIYVKQIDILAAATQNGDYDLQFTATGKEGDAIDSGEVSMPPSPSYGDMPKATLAGDTANIDIEKPLSLKIEHNPGELTDLLMVMHYQLGDE